MKKGYWVVLVLIFGMYVVQKMSVPSFESYKEKAKLNPSQSTNQQTTSVSKPDYEADLEERCKDWLFYRNRAYKLGREGDHKGAEQANRAMNQFYRDLRLHFSEKQISDEIARHEAAGYKGGF